MTVIKSQKKADSGTTKNLIDILQTPESFVERLPENDICELKNTLKAFYDDLKTTETKNKPSNSAKFSNGSSISSTLPIIIIENLDDEQIWQQIELQNNEKLSKFKRNLKLFEENGTDFDRLFVQLKEKDGNKRKKSRDDENLSDLDENPDDFFEDADENEPKNDKNKQGNSNNNQENNENKQESENSEEELDDLDEGKNDVNENGPKKKDKFFNMKEMEAFLDAQDRQEMEKIERENDENEKEDEIDEELEDLDEEDDEMDDIDGSKNYKYKDFFTSDKANNTSNKKKVSFNFAKNEQENESESEEPEEEIDELENEPDSEVKSSFESRQEKLKERIEEIEQKNLAEKPWQLTGEITARNRPENSLLEEYVEFEHTVRLPPVITQETTQRLEDIVKQRIKDKAWDDVERKIKPANEPYKYKNELILDQQKSKMSLSQIYEQEYLKQNQTEIEESKNEQHEEIRKLMKALFVKLDALTHYHYTPKLPTCDVKIVNNTKSITVEEVAPVTVGSADLLAPEEIKAKPRGELKSTEERTKTDKLRELRRKKKVAKLKVKRREEKEKLGKVPKDKMKMLQKLGKVHKNKVNLDVKNTKRKSQSSAEFFSALQATQSKDKSNKRPKLS